ncbi:MAG: putative Ig domain-containing protein, partial [Acidobacteria bacterium]|nr:putative Ig domain-containing protein [Acidobacteriota bacterium]
MRSRLIRFCAWMMWLCAALPAFSQARPSITGPSTLPGAQVGVPYSYTLQASGGQGALQWSATGLLPPGLTLAPSTGNISGIPTTAGNYGFRATVTDSLNRTDNKDFTIRVTSPLAITTTSLPAGTVGVAYSQSLTAAGGTPPYTWIVTAGSLPQGLAL